MKKLKWLIFCGLLTVACNKSSTDQILGRWELAEEIGGFAGDIRYPPGDANYLQFNADMTFTEILTAARDTITGPYQIIKHGLYPGKDLIIIKYPALTVTDSVLVLGDKLILSRPPKCCDIPYMEVYRR